MTTVGRRTALPRSRSWTLPGDRRVLLGVAATSVVVLVAVALLVPLGWHGAVVVLQWVVAVAALVSALVAGALTWRWTRRGD